MQMILMRGCRPFHGLAIGVRLDPGVPLRSTPGFMLTPAPQAEKKVINDLNFFY
jgi:hypothetical protein